MQYLHYELDATFGSVIQVRHVAAEADLWVMDERNFNRYRMGIKFEFVGGRFDRSPISIAAPGDGKWHVVVNFVDSDGCPKPRASLI